MRAGLLLPLLALLAAPAPAPTAEAQARRLLSADVRESWDAGRALLERRGSIREALRTAVEEAKLPVEVPRVLPAPEKGPWIDRIRQAALLARLVRAETKVPDGMVAVPGGVATRAVTGEEVLVADFLLDRTEVSCRAFARFLAASGHESGGEGFLEGWSNGKPPRGAEGAPVTNVSRADAEAFATWRGARLPTAEEWSIARGGTGRTTYPWGKRATAGSANVYGKGPGRPELVEGRAEGATPLGILRLAGNVTEWTASPWGEVEGAGVVAGESFLTVPAFGGPLRRRTKVTTRRRDLGFRCAASLPR